MSTASHRKVHQQTSGLLLHDCRDGSWPPPLLLLHPAPPHPAARALTTIPGGAGVSPAAVPPPGALTADHRSDGELLRPSPGRQAGLQLESVRQEPVRLGLAGVVRPAAAGPRVWLAAWMPPSGALEQAAQLDAHATERQPGKHICQTSITPQKGEEATRKTSNNLLVFRVS